MCRLFRFVYPNCSVLQFQRGEASLCQFTGQILDNVLRRLSWGMGSSTVARVYSRPRFGSWYHMVSNIPFSMILEIPSTREVWISLVLQGLRSWASSGPYLEPLSHFSENCPWNASVLGQCIYRFDYSSCELPRAESSKSGTAPLHPMLSVK